MKNKNYKLYCLINFFNVKPVFLFPVFKDKNVTEPIEAIQTETNTIFISNTKGMLKYLLSQNFSDTKFNEEVKRFIQKFNI